jgi:hypothetical protein
MSKAHAIQLPGDLLNAALKVPDFQAKLEQFARTEVALHQFRKSRFQSKSLRILANAKKASMKAPKNKERAAHVDEFLKFCDTMMPKAR